MHLISVRFYEMGDSLRSKSLKVQIFYHYRRSSKMKILIYPYKVSNLYSAVIAIFSVNIPLLESFIKTFTIPTGEPRGHHLGQIFIYVYFISEDLLKSRNHKYFFYIIYSTNISFIVRSS